MENLNAEQVKKALECCVKSECNKCPLRDGRCAKGEMGRLSLEIINSQEQRIKELTEDNEYLKTQVTATEARYESRKESDLEEVLELRLKVEELTEENDVRKRCNIMLNNELRRIDNIKADTVRKMQERLKADAVTIQDHTGKLGVVVGVGNIDDVAREMLEGENEN